MRGRITIYLDGPRTASVEVPDDFDEYVESEQDAMLRPKLEELMADGISWQFERDVESD